MSLLGCLIALLQLVLDVAYTQSRASDLVRIGGADALARGTDLGRTLVRLLCCVDVSMRGEDQMGLARDEETLAEVVSATRERTGLLGEEDGVEYYTIAYDIELVPLEDPRGDGAQDVLLALEL